MWLSSDLIWLSSDYGGQRSMRRLGYIYNRSQVRLFKHAQEVTSR
jgi:hypothetical protein